MILELVVSYNVISTLMTFRKDVMAETEDPYSAVDIVFHRTCNRTSTPGDKSDKGKDEKQCANRPHESGNHGLIEISRA